MKIEDIYNIIDSRVNIRSNKDKYVIDNRNPKINNLIFYVSSEYVKNEIEEILEEGYLPVGFYYGFIILE